MKLAVPEKLSAALFGKLRIQPSFLTHSPMLRSLVGVTYFPDVAFGLYTVPPYKGLR